MRAVKLTASVCAAALALAAAGTALAQYAMVTEPVLPDGPLEQVSPHVWVLRGFPNVAFVVGDKATLAIDTGLGPRNGATVAKAAAKLSTKSQKLYLTTTHYHPEHAGGQSAFPAGTTVIRNRAQQAEMDTEGQRIIDVFRNSSPARRELLEGVVPSKSDVLFDDKHVLDLGGVHADLYWFGPAHTQGDEVVFVREDATLVPGDVVENRLSPNINCDACSPKKWIKVLDKIAPLKPQHVVADHGDLGGGALVAQERAFLVDLQAQADALKAKGVSVDDAGKQIAAAFAVKYANWFGMQNLPASVKKAYADAP